MIFFQKILTVVFCQFAVFPLEFDSPQVKRDMIPSIINFYTSFLTSCWTTYATRRAWVPTQEKKM